MALTLKWWTDLKAGNDYKVNGRVAPETDFERKLKIYDNDAKVLDSPPKMKNAIKALADVENARRSSTNDLQRAGFAKLAIQCSPNGRVLTQKISDEKKMLEVKGKEIAAKVALGPAQMQGLGPGGSLRKKNFDTLHKIITKLHADIKRTPTLNKAQIDGALDILAGIKKMVDIYCKDRPGLKQFLDDYTHTVAGFKTVQKKLTSSKATEALRNIGTYLTRMESANYVA